MNEAARRAVYERSGGRCEALVGLPRTWARCGRPVVEVHHMLKRSRGGHLLDAEDEIYHLIALCHTCHRAAEAENDWDAGLIISGYVRTDSTTGRPIYTGPDPYLSQKYPDTERQRFDARMGAK